MQNKRQYQRASRFGYPHEYGSASLVFLLLALSCTTLYAARLELLKYRALTVEHNERPPLYLPEASNVRLVTLGYDTAVSKLLWFNTLNYFGKQFDGAQDYRWLADMCDLVTILDPKSSHAFEFCGTLLAWVAKDPERSAAIMDRAVKADPNRWRFWYMKGFTNWYFLERLDIARDDFLHASQLPDAPPFIAGIAAKLLAKDSSPTLARQMLETLIAETEDATAKKALKKRLRKMILSEQLFLLQKEVEAYFNQNNRLPASIEDLVQAGQVAAVPIDPYKGRFFIEDGKVKTTSKVTGVEFKGKTARTGMMKDEFAK